MSVNPVTLYWTLSALLGLVVTGRNFRASWLDWQEVHRAKASAALRVAAFTPFRSHALMLCIHASFLSIGVAGLVQPGPPGPPLPSDLLMLVATLAFLAVPLTLIVISVTIHDDRRRAIALARRPL